MFTGIIEELGKIERVSQKGEGREFLISASETFMKGVKPGDSIAVNGACETVTKLDSKSFLFFSSRQTLSLTNLNLLKNQAKVNLEKALSFGARLDGHLVSGHVDGTGKVIKVERQGEGYLFSFQIPENLLETVVLKGSIAVDGISFTVYDLKENEATVSVIPFSFERTTLKDRKPGDLVNLETDMLGKYVVSFLKRQNQEKKGLSLEFLKQNGFF